jgi:ammonium transporter, Amt family
MRATRVWMGVFSAILLGLGGAGSAWALEGGAEIAGSTAAIPSAAVSAIDTGDTAWVLISSLLVLMMTIPGLALFYGGLVRKKNVLSVLMQCFMITCLISIQWVLWGYSLSFGPDIKSFIGSLDWAGLKGVGLSPAPAYAATIPHQAFMIFQMMFAVITPAVVIGAFAERMKFLPFMLFILLWSTFVYDPVCHWVWGVNGFIRKMGVLDFAGGTVVEINSGLSALAAALVLGRRMGYPSKMSPPHNLPFSVAGAGLLWVGWFGFNAGSALGANGVATSALVATHVAAAMAGLAWAAMDMVFNKRPTVLGIISGAVAGLVAITPGAGFVTPIGALFIGGGAGVFCYVAVVFLKSKLGYDDALDVFGVHGVGGFWGTLATGLWATRAVNPAGADGLFHGNPGQFIIQLKAALITVGFTFVATFALLKLVDALVGLRASEREERIGLDLTDHREAAYTMLD